MYVKLVVLWINLRIFVTNLIKIFIVSLQLLRQKLQRVARNSCT